MRERTEEIEFSMTHRIEAIEDLFTKRKKCPRSGLMIKVTVCKKCIFYPRRCKTNKRRR